MVLNKLKFLLSICYLSGIKTDELSDVLHGHDHDLALVDVGSVLDGLVSTGSCLLGEWQEFEGEVTSLAHGERSIILLKSRGIRDHVKLHIIAQNREASDSHWLVFIL